MAKINHLFATVTTVIVTMLFLSTTVSSAIECSTVTALVSACSSFLSYGSPDPIPGSPCCVAMASLNYLADSGENLRDVCRCMMDLVMTYSNNATAIATVPGFCGVSLGFTIDPETDCEYMGDLSLS